MLPFELAFGACCAVQMRIQASVPTLSTLVTIHAGITLLLLEGLEELHCWQAMLTITGHDLSK